MTAASECSRAHGAVDEALLDLRRLSLHPSPPGWFPEKVGADVTLRTLRAIEAGCDDGPLGVGDVATALSVDASTASQFLEHAADAGYVGRRNFEHDRHRTGLALTAADERLLSRAILVRGEQPGRATRAWTDRELTTPATRQSQRQLDLRGLLDDEPPH